jgi:hypothetical protein
MVALYPQSYSLLRSSKARAGVVIMASSRGLLLPASITSTETSGFSVSRPATTFPVVPPVKKSDSSCYTQ